MRKILAVMALLWGLAPQAAVLAQAPDPAASDTVIWTAAIPSADVKPNSRLVLTLHGAVLDGWHVYALKQLPAGPTPLRVALDSNAVATADGAPVGSPPTRIHDPSFNLETQFYAHAFTLTVPVHIASHLAAGPQQISVSVRFQTCNGRICQPPRTVHVSTPFTVRTDG